MTVAFSLPFECLDHGNTSPPGPSGGDAEGPGVVIRVHVPRGDQSPFFLCFRFRQWLSTAPTIPAVVGSSQFAFQYGPAALPAGSMGNMWTLLNPPDWFSSPGRRGWNQAARGVLKRSWRRRRWAGRMACFQGFGHCESANMGKGRKQQLWGRLAAGWVCP